MAKKVSVQWSGDREFRYRMMRQTIEAVGAPGILWMPLLNLVATFIDGLASGPSGASKKETLEYLQKHFPGLCAALGAEVFYSKYRNKAVHEFGIGKGFAIALRNEIGDAYVDQVADKITHEELTGLNIERLVEDFLAHIQSLEASLKGIPESSPR